MNTPVSAKVVIAGTIVNTPVSAKVVIASTIVNTPVSAKVVIASSIAPSTGIVGCNFLVLCGSEIINIYHIHTFL